MLLNVSDLIDVILYWNANNCQIKKIYINTANFDIRCSCISTYHNEQSMIIFLVSHKTIHDLIDNINN